MDFIISSNGMEVYRIKSNVKLSWAPHVEKHWKPKDLPKAARALKGIVSDMYLFVAREIMKEYSWIEGFQSLESSLDIRTDYPVLDIKNRIVPDVEAAEKRLEDLRKIQAELNKTFRMAKISMLEPEFYGKLGEA